MKEDNITISAVGDISLGDHFFSLGHGPRSHLLKNNGKDLLTDVSKHFKASDIVFGNLEGVVSDIGLEPECYKSSAFRGPECASSFLKEKNFSILNIANNHSLQHGLEAFENTVTNLVENNILVLGLAKHNTYSTTPVIKNVKGKKICFLGYSTVEDVYIPNQKKYSNASIEEICSDVKLLSSDVDFIIVSAHYGVEALDEPREEDIHFSRKVIEAGANLFLGHHSHVFQRVERYKHGVIAYSLGNFVFDLPWDKRFIYSSIVDFYINKDNSINFKCLPVKIGLNGYPLIINDSEVPCFLADIIAGKLGTETVFDFQAKLKLEFRKLAYFLTNLKKGKHRLKKKFLTDKLLSKLRIGR